MRILKMIIVTTFIALFALPVFAQLKSSIAQYEFIKEKDIDIGLVALNLAKEFYPTLDVEKYSKRLDQMAAEINAMTKGIDDPDFRIRVMNTYFYKKEKFGYDYDDPRGRKLENRLLNGIMDTKKGNCYTLPLLYLTVAQRLGYPVHMVTVPDHFFLRYLDSRLKNQNIEATGQGGFSSDEEYRKDFSITNKAINEGSYLRTMTNRDLVATMLLTSGILYTQNRDYARAILYAKTAIRIAPWEPVQYQSLGEMYEHLMKRHLKMGDPEWAKIYKFLMNQAFAVAKRKNFIDLPDDEYLAKIQKKAEEQKLQQTMVVLKKAQL